MYELSPCVVVAASGTQLSGHVEHFRDGTLRVSGQASLGDLTTGSQVMLHVLDAVRGEVRLDGAVLTVDEFGVDLHALSLVSAHQRRDAARVQVDVQTKGAVEDATDPDGDPGEVTLRVLDVSATGVRMHTTRELAVGARVALRLPLSGGALDVAAQVLRREQSEAGWRYGCVLVALTERDSEALFAYVLRAQREQRRIELDRADGLQVRRGG